MTGFGDRGQLNLDGLAVAGDAHSPLLAEDVVEVSFQPPEADLLLTSFQGSFTLRLPAVRSRRARYSATGMEAAQRRQPLMDDEPTIDRYLLKFWTATPAADAIVWQTRSCGRRMRPCVLAHRGAGDAVRQPDEEAEPTAMVREYAMVSLEDYEASLQAWRVERVRSAEGFRVLARSHAA